MREMIAEHIKTSMAVKQNLLDNELDTILSFCQGVAAIFAGGGKLLICGNGGSAADAQHLAAELIIRYRSQPSRRSLPAIALTTDSSVLTAGGNDLGFDEIFARQVEGLGQPGDGILAITTSGNSSNILSAFRRARQTGMTNFLLTGRDGGRALAEFQSDIDSYITVPADNTAAIQESHLMLLHILCEVVEATLFSSGRLPDGHGQTAGGK